MLIWKKRNFNRRLYMFFVLLIMLTLLVFGVRAVSGTLITDYSDGEVLMLQKSYQTGAVYDRNGVCLVKGADKTVDKEGNGENTGTDTETGTITENGLVWSSAQIKEAFEDLLGMNISETLNSRFTIAGNASVLFGTEDNRFSGNSLLTPFQARVGGSLQLTLDAATQEKISTLIKKYGYDSSNTYIVASNYTSGEILALHGKVFDTMLHPGSVVKPLVAAAAMDVTKDVNLTEFTYNCDSGNHTFKLPKGKTFSVQCAGGAYHGNTGIAEAIKYSCNGYFINLLEKINKKKLLNELRKMGIGDSLHFQDMMFWDGRFIYKNSKKKDKSYLLASIGEADCYMTPFNVNFLTNAIFNHGLLVEPYEFIATQSRPGSEWEAKEHSYTKQVCSEEAADKVAELMGGVTKEGTLKNVEMNNWAGKTGTAQLAGEDGNLSGLYSVWTTAAYLDSEKPYSITVCLDKVDESLTSVSAGLLARDILQYLVNKNI